MPAIPSQEIADLLRAVIRKEKSVQLAEPGASWNATYVGNVVLKIAGYEVVIFNDCNEVDYVDSAISPDGRMANYDQWHEGGGDPIDLLTQDEQAALCSIFSRAE